MDHTLSLIGFPEKSKEPSPALPSGPPPPQAQPCHGSPGTSPAGPLTGDLVDLVEEFVLQLGEHVFLALPSARALRGVVGRPDRHRGSGGGRSHNGLLVPLEDVPHGGKGGSWGREEESGINIPEALPRDQETIPH